MTFHVTPRSAFFLFTLMVIFLIVQGVWWVIFMATLVDEKVELARQLGATPAVVEAIHREEISRQIMVGSEGVVFLLLLLLGSWLIYRSLVKLQELKRNQENFLMAVTHELKTPLSSLRLYLDSLQSEKITDEKKKTVLPKMSQDLGRLHQLVDNVLEAGRFQRSGYSITRDYFDLAELLPARISNLVRYHENVAITMNTNIPAGISYNGDSRALARAIDAVLQNAVKYRRGNAVTISIKLHESNERIILEIADDGSGLASHQLQPIFDRFYRVGSEMTRRQEGSGLGLYLCQEIVKAHGGNVIARSDGINKGSQFIITLKK